jgi:serine/threonine protein phosphatase PrpC
MTARSGTRLNEVGVLISQEDMVKARLFTFDCGQAAVFSARAPGKDSVNEDAAAVIPFDAQRGVLAVADGAGGQPGGHAASTVAIASLQASLQAARSAGGSLREAILEGFDRANAAVSSLGGAATTLVVVEIESQTTRTYHAGDSPVLVVGGRGRVKLQTMDHSPVGHAVAAGMLDEEDAMHHVERHLLTNCIGSAEMRVEMSSPVTLAQLDRVLLASDGLTDNLHVHEIVELIRKGPLYRAAKKLVEACLQRMQTAEVGAPSKPDDLTVILFRRDRKAPA